MAARFRKSVKLGPGVRVNFSKSGISATVGPRGYTTSYSKKGVYRNVTNPLTGVTHRTKIRDGKSSKKNGRVSRASTSGASVPKAVQEWQAYTGKRNPGVALHINAVGNIEFFDEDGVEITDPYLISIIKRTPQYKEQLPYLKEQQRSAVADMVEDMEQSNASFIKTYVSSPNVLKRPFYEVQLQRLEPEHYEPQAYPFPAPTPEDIQIQLSAEADQNVKGVPWKKRQLKEQYFNERYQDRFNEAMCHWQIEKEDFERAEAIKAEQLNAEYQEDYELTKTSLEKALQGDAEYIEAASEEWIESCELPVDISTQFEYRPEEHCLMVDLDLPEIEDLPTETAVQAANGSLKVKEKTQKVLRQEYAECVFGLAVFVASSLFNTSPVIEHVVVSGYTQRRNNVGDVVDDYIYSIKFDRERFYFLDYEKINPEVFCLSFENRCNMSTTKVFKAIEPYE